jgi:hypothetical protein
MLAFPVLVADLGTPARRHLDLLDAAQGVRARPHCGVEEGLAGRGVSDAEGTRHTGQQVCERRGGALGLRR